MLVDEGGGRPTLAPSGEGQLERGLAGQDEGYELARAAHATTAEQGLVKKDDEHGLVQGHRPSDV